MNHPSHVGSRRSPVYRGTVDMRVFIAGATGVLGRRLTERLTRAGHDVVGLTRSDYVARLIRERGGTPHRGDILDPESLVEGARGADVVVHAATKIPTETNPPAEAWEVNDRVRRDGAENLISAARAIDAARFVQQSVVWVARQPDGSQFGEEAEPLPVSSTRSALDAEKHVATEGKRHGIETVILRCGWFYAPDAEHTKRYGRDLLRGRMPIIGRGLLGRTDATLSYLHVDDAARAFVRAIEGDSTGVFHVVDDQPTTYASFLKALASRLGAARPRRVPAWLARFLVGDNLIRLLTQPMPTTNERFRDAFGWQPEYPMVASGLDHVVETWRKNDVIRQTQGGFEWVAE